MKLYILKSDSTGEFWLTFVARNGETIAHTENYKQKASARHAAELIKEQGGAAEIIDAA